MKNIFVLAVVTLSALASYNAAAENQIEAGKAAVAKSSPNCASCHGADFKTPINPDAPKLASQPKDYLRHALIAYKRGSGGPNGRNNPIMGPIARQLSEQDIEHIAAYLHSLPTTLVLQK